MVKSRSIEHQFHGETLLSELVTADKARATIILLPTVAGVSDLELGFAQTLAGKGYNAFVADLYGKEFRGSGREIGAQQMKRLRANRAALGNRLLAVIETVRGLPDTGTGIVAIGFCFGGLCALDLARTGVDIAGVASFHGLFDPTGLPPRPIKAKVIAFHGWDDPLAPPAKVVALGQELTSAGADWQIHAFGNTVHAFTNPGADAFGNPATKFSSDANRRSWRALDGFLDDLFPTNG
ncbi:MAG: dienelactone hydrolase family protein [Sphingomonas sp.]|nr:dienelactone hydrolase family protein [Sphingomonas sp.]